MPKEKLLYSFFNDFFPLYAQREDCLKPATSDVCKPREEAEEICSSFSSQYEGPFHAKNPTEIWNFMYMGPHLAITSLRQHVLCIPQHWRSSTHSWEQQYDLKALEFGKQKHCLLLQRRGCGTVSHRCQALLVLLQKLILKGSKAPEAVHYERLWRKSSSKPFSCFGYVKWKR